MNKTRRKTLNALQDRITAGKAMVEAVNKHFEAIAEELEAVRDEEEEAYDSKPEALQTDEAREPIDYMEQAMELLNAIAEACDIEQLDEAFAHIEDAKGQA